MSEGAQRLRHMLDGPDMVVAPFVFDAFQARIMHSAGPGLFDELTTLLGVKEALALGKKYEH